MGCGGATREPSLDDVVGRLPASSRAAKELRALRARIKALAGVEGAMESLEHALEHERTERRKEQDLHREGCAEWSQRVHELERECEALGSMASTDEVANMNGVLERRVHELEARLKRDGGSLSEQVRIGGRVYYEVPAGTRETECKLCSRPIAFVRTSGGKRMPVSMRTAVRDTGGRLLAEPHWGDCLARGRAPASTERPTTR